MTIDQVEPAVGEKYRNRMTGHVGTLRCFDGERVRVDVPSFPQWFSDLVTFFDEWIHAAART